MSRSFIVIILLVLPSPIYAGGRHTAQRQLNAAARIQRSRERIASGVTLARAHIVENVTQIGANLTGFGQVVSFARLLLFRDAPRVSHAPRVQYYTSTR